MSETELKLSVTADNLEAAYRWLVGQGARPAGEPLALRNRYFDTPDGQLNARRVALRLRDTGDRIIQTLKTRGQMQGGALAREEWEWDLTEPELDLERLAETPLADSPALSSLVHCFDTDFERRVLDLSTLSSNGIATEIECAIDQGVIRAAGQEAPLLEVELELKSGDETALAAVARQLVDEVPALLNTISKAEQGYYLAGVHGAPEVPQGAVAAWVSRLCNAWQANDSSQWSALLTAQQALEPHVEQRQCQQLHEKVYAALEGAASRKEPPRPVLLRTPGLAALQLELLSD